MIHFVSFCLYLYVVVIFDDLGRGSTDMSYTWNEYGRPSVFTSYSAGARIGRGEIDAVFHGGDLSYATGYSAVWDFYADMFSPVAGGTTYLSIVGNHEIDWISGDTLYTLAATNGNQNPDRDSGGECGIPTLTLYPEPAPATINEPWWSYDIGLIHFVGISSEHNFTTGSPQYLWLENDLKTVDRTVTPWVLFGSHRAMYLNSDYVGPVTSDLNVSALLIEHIEPLLWKYRVNIGFYGHNHVVQRTSAVLNKKVIQRSEVTVNDQGQVINTFALSAIAIA